MSSALLALFTRSLREDTRSKATYWTRIGIGGFILLILAGTALANAWAGAPGRSFFIGIVILQAISITFIGLSYFASAIAEEKEEQTLGLLRMTDLNPLSILLGKSTSRLCGALLMLAAQFPFTIFAVTLGGVSLRQIVATYCTLAAYTFLLCNVALLGSVLARSTARAAVFSILVICFLLTGGPLLGLLQHLLPPLPVSDALASIGGALWQSTLIARLNEVLSTGFADSPVGWQVESNLALGAGCFLLAWAAFERSCDRTSVEAVASGPLPRPAVGVRLGRPPRPVNDALVWKDYHFLCGGRLGRTVRLCGYGGALAAGLWEWHDSREGGPGGIRSIFFFLVPFVFSIDVGAMAAGIFRSEIRDQTLSALAGLPFTMREIASRKARACVIAAAPGALSVAGGGALFLLSLSGSDGMGEMRGVLTVQMIGTWVSIILLVHLVAWFSLTMKRGALPVGYVITKAVQMVASAISMILGALALGLLSRGSPGNEFWFVFLSPLLGCIASLVVAFILHRKIPRRLETLAGES